MENGSIQGAVTDLENEVLALRRRCEQVQMSIDDLTSRPIDQCGQHLQRGRLDEPSIITHSHFDSSISHWFPAAHDIYNERKTSFPRVNVQALAGNQLSDLYEYVFRLGGVSAFLLQPQGDSKLLGIRFDPYDASQCSLVSPYYLILQQESENDPRRCDVTFGSDRDNSANTDTARWSVHGHTLPNCIMKGEIAVLLTSPVTEHVMRQLVGLIRDALLLTH